MDLSLFAGVVVGGLVLLLVIVFMLNRAWGDFPGRSSRSMQQRMEELAPSRPTVREQPQAAPLASGATIEATFDERPFELPAGAPEQDLLPITHPGVRQAVLQALERGGSQYATYFVRNDEQVYLAAHRIADPLQRAQIVRTFEALNGGTTKLSPFDLLETMRQLSRQ